jgi:hypothetical protein
MFDNDIPFYLLPAISDMTPIHPQKPGYRNKVFKWLKELIGSPGSAYVMWMRIRIQEQGNLPKLKNKPDFQLFKKGFCIYLGMLYDLLPKFDRDPDGSALVWLPGSGTALKPQCGSTTLIKRYPPYASTSILAPEAMRSFMISRLPDSAQSCSAVFPFTDFLNTTTHTQSSL